MALGRKRTTENDGDSSSAEIDMTPMLDVVFIMLIFFIVTASFAKESGINLNRPPISDTPLDVRANVERAHAENPKVKVIIEAHPKSKTNTFILVSDQAREAGVADIALTTSP
mgnify:CR=1 FL=1